jgi:hypothetical protein
MVESGHMLVAAGVNIANTKAAQTITSLVASATAWLAGLAATGVGLMIGDHALMRNFSGGDAATDAHHLQAMKKVLVGTVIATAAADLAHFAATLF